MTPVSRIIAACLALVTLSTACTGGEPPEPPEHPAISVGVAPTAAAAPFFLARSEGYFAQEGLTVDVRIVAGGAVAIPELMGKSLDLAEADYVSTLVAYENDVPLEVVGEMYRAAPRAYGLVVPADSPVTEVAQLKGKVVGVNTLRSTATLAVTRRLAGVPATFREKPYPEMTGALAHGKLDAALLAEPWLTNGLRSGALRQLGDPLTGPAAGLPMAGWMTTRDWRKTNPRTLDAFRRALAKAQHLAATDQEKVRKVLPTYTKLDQGVTGEVTLGAYPTATDAAALQRVADLMLEEKYLNKPMDVRKLLSPASGAGEA
ncbi:ABC transporter substrate-binding protein [Nonomuraea maritima]|uniref:ABC transporter substrate-binding protein n=1 Tax=Nonomuraea maritima TaxID=683260 RepID=UPI003716B653